MAKMVGLMQVRVKRMGMNSGLLSCLLMLVQPAGTPLLTEMTELAAKRDISGLVALSDPAFSDAGRFSFLRTNGIYGSGRTGWKPVFLRSESLGLNLIVFSTKISCEDIGEQVFEIKSGKIGKKITEFETFGLQMKHHDFTVRFETDKNLGVFRDSVTFERVGAFRSTGLMRIAPDFVVSEVTDSTGKKVDFAQAGGTIAFRQPASSKFVLNLKYSAVLKSPPEHGSVFEDEAMLAGSVWWPSIARQAATSSATIYTKPNWLAFTHGSKIGEKIVGNSKITRYKNSVPISVFSLAAGEYKIREKMHEGIRFWSAEIGGENAVLDLQNDFNIQVVRLFGTLIKWPYDNWGSLISNRFGSGGLEAYSYASYEKGWLPELDPHEPSHTFWGGVIPNTYMKSLWNESFADFSEDWFYREYPDGNRDDLRLAFRKIPRVAPSFAAAPGYTAGVESGNAGYGIGYSRGGSMLTMLEQEIGPDAMRETMAFWLKNHPRGMTGEWDDYEKVVKTVTKADHAWFFDQWNRRAGWAELEVSDVVLGSDGTGYTIQANVKTGENSYKLRMDALVRFKDGSSALLWIPDVDTSASDKIFLRVPKQPVSVTFDPYQKILRRVNNAELRQSISGVINAASIWTRPGDEAMAQLFAARRRSLTGELPEDLHRKMIIGNPEKDPKMAEILAKIPDAPKVSGGVITWRGKSVGLDKGGFIGRVKLEDDQWCIVSFGTARSRPSLGQSDGLLFDSLGLPLAATAPAAKDGPLHFNLTQ